MDVGACLIVRSLLFAIENFTFHILYAKNMKLKSEIMPSYLSKT